MLGNYVLHNFAFCLLWKKWSHMALERYDDRIFIRGWIIPLGETGGEIMQSHKKIGKMKEEKGV